jgi:hypothetical protein
MKIASCDDDLQTALEFLQTALVCDPRNAEVKADLDLIKRLQKTRADAPLLLEKQPAACLRDVDSALRLVPLHFKLQVLLLKTFNPSTPAHPPTLSNPPAQQTPPRHLRAAGSTAAVLEQAG